MYFCVVLCIVCFVRFSVLFVYICVLNYCHRVAKQLQLNISYHYTKKREARAYYTLYTNSHLRVISMVKENKTLSSLSIVTDRRLPKYILKQYHYRPGQSLRVPGGRGSQILRQSAHESGKVVSPTHRPPLPQEIFLVLISVRG